ncbi:ribokinase [Chloroflexia bacterium SDU3-3]|nr:ribokinase [Chloroflexia bacterium SDU3-3]
MDSTAATGESGSGARATPDVVVIGAACIDIKGRALSSSVQGTSNPGMVRISAGGCARNIAENLARLGSRAALLSVVCEDDFGQAIIQQTERAGVNTDHVLMNCSRHSAAYMALLDSRGRLLFGLDDTESIEALSPAYVADHADLIRSARMVMMDANLPLETAEAILEICSDEGIAVGLDPVAYMPALRYRPYLGQFSLVVPNAIEAQALTGIAVNDVEDGIRAAKQLVSFGVELAVVTLSGAGVSFATSDVSGHVPAPDVEIVDATGASDAMTATIIYGIQNHLQIDEAVRLGVSAATLTLQTSETVRQDLSLESLYAQLVI